MLNAKPSADTFNIYEMRKKITSERERSMTCARWSVGCRRSPTRFFFPRGPKNTESYSKRRKTKPTTKSQMLKSRKKEAFRRKKRRSGEKEMVEDEIICIVGVGWVYKLDVLRMELTFSQTLCNTASLATFFSSFNNKHKQDELLRNGEFFWG